MDTFNLLIQKKKFFNFRCVRYTRVVIAAKSSYFPFCLVSMAIARTPLVWSGLLLCWLLRADGTTCTGSFLLVVLNEKGGGLGIQVEDSMSGLVSPCYPSGYEPWIRYFFNPSPTSLGPFANPQHSFRQTELYMPL